ncbi:MAG: hypothetical protein HZB39_19740, partial [Planctomycetes bacterium]|nr:hypothetical protein [Planctomycetota bacterium]
MRATIRAMVCCGAVLAACASGPDLARFDAVLALESARRGRVTLEESSRDADPLVRRAACRALGALGDPLGEAALAE